MGFTIPNSPDAAFADQAEPDAQDLRIITDGSAGTGVLTGCAVTAQGSPDMTVAVAAGGVIVAGAYAAVTAGNVTITAADGTNPRFDLIVVSSAGVKSATAGTASSNPVFPTIPASSVVLAAVYVPASDTAINSNQIVDKRVSVGPPRAPQLPALVAPFDPRLITGNAVFTANDMRGVRCIVPRSGTLVDFHIYVAVSSGNVKGFVWDSTVTTRNKLWDSGSVACPTVTSWGKIGDPNIAVTAGQHIDLAFACDNGTAAFGRAVMQGAVIGFLPTSFLPTPDGATRPAINWVVASSFSPASTFAEASFGGSANCFFVMARVA